MCDLLVVCGRYIIIFSEKTVAWPDGDLNLAWSRWAKRTIRDGAKQTKGAERWINEFPNRIFLDRECKKPFPLDLPPPEDRIIHRVVVANGALEACRKHIPESAGSLVIKPKIKQNEHWLDSPNEVEPFAIGDIDPSGTYVHVLTGATLEIIMRELDTIRDFADYLEKKAAFIRSKRLSQVKGEENLLAYYAVRINEEGDHDFVVDDSPIEISSSSFEGLVGDPRYIAKKQEDKISYLWDRLITTFTTHMLNGTSVIRDGYDFDLKESEVGVRYMALERRFSRRNHGKLIEEALERGRKEDLCFRVMMNSEDAKENETAFFILAFQYKDLFAREGGYEGYRTIRAYYAQTYAMGLLERFSYLKRVIGISCEPPGQKHGGSEDMVYVQQTEWTEEQRREIKQDCERCDVLREDFKTRQFSAQEFPNVG